MVCRFPGARGDSEEGERSLRLEGSGKRKGRRILEGLRRLERCGWWAGARRRREQGAQSRSPGG